MSYPALVVMTATNVETAKAIYTALLGVEPYVDSEYYIGFKAGNGEIGLDPHGDGGALPYWDVDDLDATIAALTAAGATVVSPSTVVARGLTITLLADGDGNPIGLRHTTS